MMKMHYSAPERRPNGVDAKKQKHAKKKNKHTKVAASPPPPPPAGRVKGQRRKLGIE